MAVKIIITARYKIAAKGRADAVGGSSGTSESKLVCEGCMTVPKKGVWFMLTSL